MLCIYLEIGVVLIDCDAFKLSRGKNLTFVNKLDTCRYMERSDVCPVKALKR